MSEATFGAWGGRPVQPRPGPVSYKTTDTVLDGPDGVQVRTGVIVFETVSGESVTFWTADSLGALIEDLQDLHSRVQKPLVQLASVLPTSRTNGPPRKGRRP
jgi:hypothetical protein